LSHGAIAAFLGAYGERLNFASADAMFSWLPMYHDLGFINYLLVPLSLGVPLQLMPPEAFLADYSSWLTELTRQGGTHSAAPNFAYALVGRVLANTNANTNAGSIDLSLMKSFGCGGELIDPSIIRRFLELAGGFGLRGNGFAGGYGLAEAVCAVSFRGFGLGFSSDVVDRSALASGTAQPAVRGEGSAEFASVGTPMPGLEVMVADSGGEGLSERSVGEIIVRGPTVMDGYLNDEPATDAVIKDGWLHTGDIGYIADGDLYVTGRAKDVIIVRGQNYFAGDIERVAEKVSGARKGGCVAVPVRISSGEEIGLIVETNLESAAERDECREQLARAIWTETGIVPRKVHLVAPGTLPKTSSGKPQRLRARQLLDGS
jgi:fatty-acyl-CoA synthase